MKQVVSSIGESSKDQPRLRTTSIQNKGSLTERIPARSRSSTCNISLVPCTRPIKIRKRIVLFQRSRFQITFQRPSFTGPIPRGFPLVRRCECIITWRRRTRGWCIRLAGVCTSVVCEVRDGGVVGRVVVCRRIAVHADLVRRCTSGVGGA
jgi:hypothetical protein